MALTSSQIDAAVAALAASEAATTAAQQKIAQVATDAAAASSALTSATSLRTPAETNINKILAEYQATKVPGAPPVVVVPPVVVPPTTDVIVPAPADAGKIWKTVFNDDFSTSLLDRSKWTPCFTWAGTNTCTVSFNNGREGYDPGQLHFPGDGMLHMVAQPGSVLGKSYKSGLISTTNDAYGGKPWNQPLFQFKYGYVEMRAKLPNESGMFSAFWMLPVAAPVGGNYSYNYEIDIIEAFGGADASHAVEQTVLFNMRKSQYKKISNFNYWSDYHTYGMAWYPDKIIFYIDGKETGRYVGDTSMCGPSVLILDLMVDQDYQHQKGFQMVGTPTGEIVVDYIRISQQA